MPTDQFASRTIDEGGPLFIMRGIRGSIYLLDLERGARFERLRAGNAESTVQSARVTWGGLALFFDFDSTITVDPATGRQIHVYTACHFSERHGPECTRSSRVPWTAEERTAMRLLTAEALLVRHHMLTEGEWDVGTACVDMAGRRWRANDFGYRTGADVRDGSPLAPPAVFLDALKWTGPAKMRADLGQADDPDRAHQLYVQMRDPKHDRMLRVWQEGASHWIEISSGDLGWWSDDVDASPELVGLWLRAFADGTYALTRRRLSWRFAPEGGAPVPLHVRRLPAV